jgi:hypothetical protein
MVTNSWHHCVLKNVPILNTVQVTFCDRAFQPLLGDWIPTVNRHTTLRRTDSWKALPTVCKLKPTQHLQSYMKIHHRIWLHFTGDLQYCQPVLDGTLCVRRKLLHCSIPCPDTCFFNSRNDRAFCPRKLMKIKVKGSLYRLRGLQKVEALRRARRADEWTLRSTVQFKITDIRLL